MSSIRKLAFVTGVIAMTGLSPAFGQVAGAPGLNGALLRLFNGVTAFTADLNIRMVNEKNEETLNAPMQFSLLDGKMRGELDVTRLKSKDLPAFASAAARSVGMDRVVTLVRPDKKESYLVYPAFKACVVAPLADQDVESFKSATAQKPTPLGRETVDGHPCVKNKLTMTDADGTKLEAIVWNATDMKSFPVKIQFADGTDTVFMHFQKVKFEREDSSKFDLPAGTARYNDAKDLTTAVMKKVLGQAFGK